MKIGIITFHCATNYGAVLQAIGLCDKLKELGHETTIIDYRPAFITDRYNPYKVYRKSLKRMIYEVRAISYKVAINKQFDIFNAQYMETTEETYYTNQEIHNTPPKFDIYITGSDQVWNPQLTGRKVDDAYYLGFASSGTKKISYAASFGSTKIDKCFWDDIASNIRNLDHVSVRESDGQDFIKEITGVEAAHVLDPVLLLDKFHWSKFADESESDGQPYILIYALSPDDLLDEIARKVANVLNLQVVSIAKPLTGINKYDQHIHSCGPGKFLELFKNATVVCTNSFHGTAFSIVFEKPFLVIPSSSRNERMDSLLKLLGLTSKKVSSVAQLEGISIQDALEYDLNNVSILLNKERKKSLDFLQNNIYHNNKHGYKFN